MVGRCGLPFGGPAYFQRRDVSFRECIYTWTFYFGCQMVPLQGVWISHPLGFNFHPLEGAGIWFLFVGKMSFFLTYLYNLISGICLVFISIFQYLNVPNRTTESYKYRQYRVYYRTFTSSNLRNWVYKHDCNILQLNQKSSVSLTKIVIYFYITR